MATKSRFEEDLTAKTYEAYYDTKYKRADQLEKNLLTKLFSTFPDSKNALEVGCGTSHFTRWVESKLGLECYGVDTSKAMLSEAKKKWRAGNLIQSDGHHLPLKDKSFDVVFFITSLEYMPSSAKAVKEAARIAKQGIILGLMNKNNLSTFRKKVSGASNKGSFYQRTKFYSYSDIKKILGTELQGKYAVNFHSTTVFPRIFGDLESSSFPFGAFLGIAVKLSDTNE